MIRRISFERTLEIYGNFKKLKDQYNENQLLQISDILISNLLFYKLVKKTKKVLFFLLERYGIVLITKCPKDNKKELQQVKINKEEEEEEEGEDIFDGYISIREKKYFLIQRKIRLNFLLNRKECVSIINKSSEEFDFFHMKARTLYYMSNMEQLEVILQKSNFTERRFFYGLQAMMTTTTTTTNNNNNNNKEKILSSSNIAMNCFKESKEFYMLGLVFYQREEYEKALRCLMKELFEKPEIYSSNYFIWIRIGDCYSKLSNYSKVKLNNNNKTSSWINTSILELYTTKQLLEFSQIAYKNALNFLPPKNKIIHSTSEEQKNINNNNNNSKERSSSSTTKTSSSSSPLEQFNKIRQKLLLKLSHLHLRQENPHFALLTLKQITDLESLDDYDKICFLEYTLESLIIRRKWRELENFLSDITSTSTSNTNTSTTNNNQLLLFKNLLKQSLVSTSIIFRPYLLYLIYLFQGKIGSLEQSVFSQLTSHDEEKIKKNKLLLKKKKNKEEESGEESSDDDNEEEEEEEMMMRQIDPRLQIVRLISYFLVGHSGGVENIGKVYGEKLKKMLEKEKLMRNCW